MTVRRSLAQQEEYRMRDGDGSREPGTETTVPPLTPLAELLEALRANADDEINRTLDNGAAAAGYRNALHLVEYFAPKIESEAVRRGARIGRRVRGSEAEARQQGRDRGLRAIVAADVEAAPTALAMIRSKGFVFDQKMGIPWEDMNTVERWATLAFSLYTDLVEVSERARRALASADGPPELGTSDFIDEAGHTDACIAQMYRDAGIGPPEPGIDVERLARTIEWASGQFIERGNHLQAAEVIAREYDRLSADGDSPGGAE